MAPDAAFLCSFKLQVSQDETSALCTSLELSKEKLLLPLLRLMWLCTTVLVVCLVLVTELHGDLASVLFVYPFPVV